jgi:hypothetical protein
MVTTAFGFTEHFRAMQHPDVRAAEERDRPLRAAAFAHGDVAGADVVLIPRLNYHAPAGLLNTSDTTGHFTIGVYLPQTGVVHHYDPLQTPVDDNMRQYYRRVVGTLHTEGDQQYRFLRVIGRPANRFNRQEDGVNCGFYAAMVGELVLLRGHNNTYIPRFDSARLQQQRRRIVTFLRGIHEGRLPYYLPPPATQHRTPVSIPHHFHEEAAWSFVGRAWQSSSERHRYTNGRRSADIDLA